MTNDLTTNPKANTGRIAKNTLFLALRQLLVMFIALYTSRVILEALGEVDFGIYNVVAGISSSFVFFSVTLATVTQRFLSYEIGRGNQAKLRRVFSISFWTMVLLASLTVIIGGSSGYWIVYKVLNIPAARMADALIVFYATVLTFAIILVFSVYEAVLIARENMKIYAYLGISDAVVKLAIAFTIMWSPEKLITYGLLMVLAMLIPKIIMFRYCRKHYSECRIERAWDKGQFMAFIKFSGWNVYQSLVWIINSEGINVVLNIFFGPIVNAARGVAQQVNGAIVNFSLSFFTAVRPQIIKSYAADAFNEVRKLVSLGSRGSFFLIWTLSLPVMLRIHYILSFWLVETPEYTASFIRWTLVFNLINSLVIPLEPLSQATGDLKRYMMIAMNTYLAAFPIAAGVLVLGAPAWAVYPVLITGRFAGLFAGIYAIRPYIHLSYRRLASDVLLPASSVVLLTFGIAYGLNQLFADTILGVIGFGLISVFVTLATIFFIGISRTERKAVIGKLQTVLHKN